MTANESAALQHQLTATAGGFLRNLVIEGTCSRCFTPTTHQPLCPRCQDHATTPGLPSAVGFMTYASHHAPIEQSGRVMRTYKAPNDLAPPNAVRTVSLLAAVVLRGHRHCASRLAGVNVTHWAVVPSLPPKSTSEHALAPIVRTFNP